MHGGVKVYHGGASGARAYLEADCGIADDYYLAEGTGIAQCYGADADGHVIELDALDGAEYEAWVAGLDPDTGEPKSRLRTDERAVRFVEVTVNRPKSWSLAAELHPDIAEAYEAAQDRAAAQVICWLGQHATARVGPRRADRRTGRAARGGHGAALHLTGGESAPAPAPAGQRPGLGRGRVAGVRHRGIA